MRLIRPLVMLSAILALPAVLTGCGSTTEHRTVIVQPPPGQTVVIPSSGHYYYSDCPREPDC
jgi:hypothetical protein